MDKIGKVLRSLTAKERKLVREILKRVQAKDLRGFHVKKLKGREDIFRVRKGDFRIIFRMIEAHIFVLSVERKSEHTYDF